MSQQIQLSVVEDKLKVVTPYNAEFVQKCRNFRGKFSNGAWWFDDSIIEHVREAMIEFFGTTGERTYETCILVINDFTSYEDKGPVTLFGRTIAKAYGRDSGARLGDGIVFISGEYDSGGSSKNWSTEVKNATFEIHNFPVPALQLYEVQEYIKSGKCVVKEMKKKRDTDQIKNEITELQARLAELEKELQNVA